MPTKEMYKKYEGNQTKDKVVDSSAGGLFKGEHWSQQYSKELTFEHPSQQEINEMAAASHKPTTSYEKMPDYIKDKPAITEVYKGTTYDIAYENNQEYLAKTGASQEPGKRIYGEQED